MHTSVCAPCEAESSVSPFAKAWRLEKGEMHVKISLLLDQKDVPRGSCSEAIVTLVFVKRLLCERKLNGEGLWCVEMPFPRGREKAEKSGFSWVYLLKGVDVSDEMTGQQVQSKKGGPHFPQHHVLGLHGSAPLAALLGPKWAHKRATEKKPLWSYY